MIQPKKDKSRILYDAVSKDYNLGTYDEFKTKLQDDTKRKAFYDGVGKEYNLGSYNEFETKLGGLLKKKDIGNSTSQNTNMVSGQETEAGLSGTSQGQLVKDIDAGKYDERIDELQTENQTSETNQNATINNLLERYKNETDLNDSDFEEVNQTIENENQGNFGFINAIKDFASRAWTGFKPLTPKQIAVNKLKKEQELSDTEAESLYTKNRKQELLNEKTQAKTEDFIENLSADDKTSLENHFSIKTGSLSNTVAKDLLGIENVSKAIENIDSQLIEIKNNWDKDQDYPETYYQNNQKLLQERNTLLETYNNQLTEFGKKEDDLLSTQEELDLFKRNYGKWDNFTGKLGIATEELGLNLGYLLNKIPINSGAISGLPNTVIETAIIGEKKKLEEERSLLRKPKSVSNLQSWEDAGEWAMDLVAEQTPNTILMATTGGASLPIMGATATGGKLYQLEDEERQGVADYTNFEKYGAAFLTGTAEALSEKISLGQISKAKRVFSSVSKDALKDNTLAYIKKNLPEYSKDVFLEGSSEALSQFAENITDKYLLGKDVNLTEGLDEAFISGAFMSGVVYKMPGLAKATTQPFIKKDTNQKIGEGFESVLKINAELQKDISPTTRTALETKKESILDNTKTLLDADLKNIDNLNSKQKGDLLAIENEKYKLRKEAKSINEDAALESDTKTSLLQDVDSNIEKLNVKKETILNAKSEENTKKTQEQEVENVTPKTKTKPEGLGVEDTPSPIVELNPENTNETTPTNDTETNGGVQPKPETSEQQREDNNVQQPIESTTGKKTPEVKRINPKGVKGEFDVTYDANDNVSKIVSAKDGREIPKFVERKVKPTKDNPKGLKLVKNGNYAKIEAEVKGVPTENQNTEARKVQVNESLDKYNLSDAYSHALNYIARGGNVSFQSIKKETGLSDKEIKWATGFKKDSDLPSVEAAAENIVANSDLGLDMQDVRNALIDIYSSNKGINQVEDIIITEVENNQLEQQESELNAYKNSLNEKDLAIFESILAEEDYLSELSYDEKVEYYEQQFQRPQDIDGERNGGATSVQEREGKTKQETKGLNTEQASQASIKALTSERIQYSKQNPKNSPKKLNAIIREVGDKLKATLVYGKSRRRGVAGTYTSSNTLVKIRNAGDLDTAAHEIGHLLDDRHNLLGSITNDKITKQLDWFSDRGGSNPPKGLSKDKQKDYLQREGLAEFIHAYVANPKEAKVIAPELFNHFESTIDVKTKTILHEFSQDFLDFANASYGEQILSNVEDSNLKDKKGFKAWLNQFKGEDGRLNIHWLDKVKSNWTNSMHVANKAFAFIQDLQGNTIKNLKPEDNFEVLSRLLAGINGKLNSVLNKGLVNSKNKIIKDSKGSVMNINYLLESLDNTSEQTLQTEMDDVIKLLIAERTIEYVAKFERTNSLTGIGGGVKSDLEVAQGHLNDVKQLKKDNPDKYNRIKEAARRYREFADAGLKYAVEKGRISQEQYDRIKETNEYYVSLARTKEVTPTDEILPFLNESNKISSVKEVIKKAKGGTDVIKNPYLSLLHNTINFIKESDRNEVMLSFVEPLSAVREMGDGTPIDLSQIARQVPSGEKNTIKVFKDGELQHWQFDQDIYDSLKGLEGISHNPLINALGKPADLIRFTVTNFPVFAMRNAFRDTMSRLVISRTRGKVSDLWHNKEDRELFETYGGSQAGFYLTNHDAYKDQMNKAVKELTKKGHFILDPRKINYKNYRKLLERGENLNRVAEYKSAYRKAKKDGMDDYNAGLFAAYQARDLMDFAVAGHYMRVINKLIPFSNASIQSVKRSVKGAKENPGKFALRMAIFTVLPQIAFRALVSASGDEEEYEQLPDYQRDLFWNFKTPFTGDIWICLPKPFELGLPSSLIDRGISKANGNDDAFDGATMSSIKTLFPFDETALVGSLKPIIEASGNHDFFRDRDIVPFWEKDKMMELREGTKYASRIGNALSDTFGFVGAEIDPRKIDHIIKGYTTYYGDWALSLSDIGNENSRHQFNFTKTGFAKDIPISNAKSVQKAMKIAKEIGADSDKNVKVLKGMIKVYYDLEDKNAKKTLSKNIYEYSKQIIPYLEAKKQINLVKSEIKKAN